MSLRAKILILFVTLAIAPIIAIGFADYAHSIQSLEQVVRSKVEALAETSAGELGQRYAMAEAELRVLAQHDAVERHLTAVRGGTDVPQRTREALNGYIATRRNELSDYFASIEVLDPAGAVVAKLDLPATGEYPSRCSNSPTLATLSHDVVNVEGERLGALVAVPRLEAMLPLAVLDRALGSSGYSLVVDRTTGISLYSQICAFVGRDAHAVLGPGPWEQSDPAGGTHRGQIRYGEEGDERFAAYVALAHPPWTVLSTAATAEWTVPFGRLRLFFMIYIAFIALGAGGAFSILSHGVMRSLNDLTAAAEGIGRGGFDQWLPPPTSDEVGRLSYAIATMIEKLRRMMGEVELGRQLAVVGKMSSYLAHEIRNPLSSIRLNLQGVAREAGRGEVSRDLPEVIDLCLTEVNRLETVVQSVLRLGAMKPGSVRPTSVHRLIRESLDLLAAELRRRKIRPLTELAAENDMARADPEQIKGVLLNLFLNAADAMPGGGTFLVRTSNGATPQGDPAVEIRVTDDGPGVPEELREDIFEPFFTTKKKGSGIGLSISRVTAEQHGGRLYVGDASTPERTGAEFVLELPLAGGRTLGRIRRVLESEPEPEPGATPQPAGALVGSGESDPGDRHDTLERSA